MAVVLLAGRPSIFRPHGMERINQKAQTKKENTQNLPAKSKPQVFSTRIVH
jgi:hypothetical protein